MTILSFFSIPQSSSLALHTFQYLKKKKKNFIATTACYVSFSPFLPYLRAFCPPNSPPLFQIKAPFNYHQSTPTQPRSKIKLKNSSLILHISQLQIYKKEKKNTITKLGKVIKGINLKISLIFFNEKKKQLIFLTIFFLL